MQCCAVGGCIHLQTQICIIFRICGLTRIIFLQFHVKNFILDNCQKVLESCDLFGCCHKMLRVRYLPLHNHSSDASCNSAFYHTSWSKWKHSKTWTNCRVKIAYSYGLQTWIFGQTLWTNADWIFGSAHLC